VCVILDGRQGDKSEEEKLGISVVLHRQRDVMIRKSDREEVELQSLSSR